MTPGKSKGLAVKFPCSIPVNWSRLTVVFSCKLFRPEQTFRPNIFIVGPITQRTV